MSTYYVDKVKVNTGSGSYDAELKINANNVIFVNSNDSEISLANKLDLDNYPELKADGVTLGTVLGEHNGRIEKLEEQLINIGNIKTIIGPSGKNGENGNTVFLAYSLKSNPEVGEISYIFNDLNLGTATEYYMGIAIAPIGTNQDTIAPDGYTWLLMGRQGPKGEKGELSDAFRILGTLASESEIAKQIEPVDKYQGGDAFFIGASEPRDLYVYQENDKKWVNQGNIKGETAFEIAQKYDTTLTNEKAWIESLKGDSAFEIARQQDKTLKEDDENKWLESLKGKPGQPFVGTTVADVTISQGSEAGGNLGWNTLTFTKVEYVNNEDGTSSIDPTKNQLFAFTAPTSEGIFSNLRNVGTASFVSNFASISDNDLQPNTINSNLLFSGIIGNDNNITGASKNLEYSLLIGHNNTVEMSGKLISNLYIFGNHNTYISHVNSDKYKYIFGEYADITDDTIFVIGNGKSNEKSNLLTINSDSFNYNNLLTIDKDNLKYQGWTLATNQMNYSGLLAIDNSSFNYKNLLKVSYDNNTFEFKNLFLQDTEENAILKYKELFLVDNNAFQYKNIFNIKENELTYKTDLLTISDEKLQYGKNFSVNNSGELTTLGINIGNDKIKYSSTDNQFKITNFATFDYNNNSITLAESFLTEIPYGGIQLTYAQAIRRNKKGDLSGVVQKGPSNSDYILEVMPYVYSGGYSSNNLTRAGWIEAIKILKSGETGVLFLNTYGSEVDYVYFKTTPFSFLGAAFPGQKTSFIDEKDGKTYYRYKYRKSPNGANEVKIISSDDHTILQTIQSQVYCFMGLRTRWSGGEVRQILFSNGNKNFLPFCDGKLQDAGYNYTIFYQRITTASLDNISDDVKDIIQIACQIMDQYNSDYASTSQIQN